MSQHVGMLQLDPGGLVCAVSTPSWKGAASTGEEPRCLIVSFGVLNVPLWAPKPCDGFSSGTFFLLLPNVGES